MRSREVMNVPPLLLTEEKYSKTFSGGLWTRNRFSYIKKMLRRYSGVRKKKVEHSKTDAARASTETGLAVKVPDVSDLPGSQSIATQPADPKMDAAHAAYKPDRKSVVLCHTACRILHGRKPLLSPRRQENARLNMLQETTIRHRQTKTTSSIRSTANRA